MLNSLNMEAHRPPFVHTKHGNILKYDKSMHCFNILDVSGKSGKTHRESCIIWMAYQCKMFIIFSRNIGRHSSLLSVGVPYLFCQSWKWDVSWLVRPPTISKTHHDECKWQHLKANVPHCVLLFNLWQLDESWLCEVDFWKPLPLPWCMLVNYLYFIIIKHP